MSDATKRKLLTRRNVLGGLMLPTAAIVGFRWSPGRRQGDPGFGSGRRIPWELTPSAQAASNPLDARLSREIRDKIRLRPDMSFGGLLHWLRVFGTGAQAAEYRAEVVDVLGDLVDAERLKRRFDARSSLLQTPYGMRYSFTDPRSPTSSPEQGRHAYQPLAVLAELGVPTDFPLATPDRDGTVADLIRDCLQNFQLREVADVEPEWATIAIALYLPPISSWRNRWGDRVTLDGLARFLLRQRVTESACVGTHALFAAAVLAQMHRRFSLLGAEAVDGLDGLFAATVSALARAQRPDGSWGGDWSGPGSPHAESTELAVLVTGHVLESLMYLPPQHRVSDEAVARGLGFLLKAIEAASDSEVASHYCPYSHAVRVLLNWPAR